MTFTGTTVLLPLFYDEHQLYGRGPTSFRKSHMVLTLLHRLQNAKKDAYSEGHVCPFVCCNSRTSGRIWV